MNAALLFLYHQMFVLFLKLNFGYYNNIKGWTKNHYDYCYMKFILTIVYSRLIFVLTVMSYCFLIVTNSFDDFISRQLYCTRYSVTLISRNDNLYSCCWDHLIAGFLLSLSSNTLMLIKSEIIKVNHNRFYLLNLFIIYEWNCNLVFDK